MRDLIIYHPGTGTVMPLSDEMYVIDCGRITEYANEALDMGATDIDPREHLGYRLDNHNIGWLFFGDANV